MKPSLIAALAAALLVPVAASAAPVPSDAEWTEAYIPGTPGGDPTLHVDILKPKGTPADAKLPAIVSVGPYFNHSGSTTPDYDPTASGPNDRWKDLETEGKIFKRGYALVLVDLRGFGGSEGCNDFGGPGEQADSKRAVEWTAQQPWSTGKVGMWGKSYDAWTEVMALNGKAKGLAAAVIQSPIIDGYRTLYMNGVHYGTGWYATPGLYQSQDAMPPTANDSPEYYEHALLGLNPACYGANIAQQDGLQDHDDAAGFWKARDLPQARGSDVPVLWSHGFMDANTKPDNFLPVWETLTGPRRAWFGQYEHVRGNEAERTGHKGFFDEAFRWFDRYVKGDTSVDTSVDPAVEVAEGDGRWRGETQWPPADAVARTMALKDGTYSDDGSNDAEGSGAGVGIWSISAPLPYDVHLAGTAKIRLSASTSSPRANLVGLLYDIGADNKATLIQRGATVVPPEGNVGLELYPDDWTLKTGHRIGVLIAGSDESWWTPVHTNLPVDVSGGSIELPLLTYERTDYLLGTPTPIMDTRRPFAVDSATIASATVAFELPPALAPRPAGTPQGAAKPPAGAVAKPANRLTLRIRARGRRITVIVRGAGASRVRLALLRGKRTVVKRTVRARANRVRITFKAKRAGRYRVVAKLRGPVKLSGRSKRIRIR